MIGFPLNKNAVYQAYRDGVISLPDITESEIRKLSSTDWFVIVLAFLHVLRLFAQACIRYSREDLTLSQLEVAGPRDHQLPVYLNDAAVGQTNHSYNVLRPRRACSHAETDPTARGTAPAPPHVS